MIQCFGPSVSIIVRYPGGISGGSWPTVRLHTEHGIPAPPQWQASSRSLAPSHGLSGWSSHTQRAPPQTSHSDVSISPRPLFILIPQALEFQVARAHIRRYEADGLVEVRTWRSGSGTPVLLRLLFRSLRSSRLMSADSLDRTTRTRATPGLDGRRAALTLGYLVSRFEHRRLSIKGWCSIHAS